MEESSFGDLLRRHRSAVGLTQQELAERAGMSVRGVSDLERAVRRAPHRDTVLRLAQALGLEGVQSLALLAASRRRLARMDISTTLAASLSLPLSMSTLVGRELQMVEVRARLQSARLLTLTGPGGIGKTRLALEVGRRLADGGLEVALVELASVSDSALVHQTTAAALAIEEQPGTPHLATLVRSLQARRMLVVLDNCEHVIQTCAELADALLRFCPELHILATSREPLRINGESIWQVPPLTVPDTHTPPILDAVSGTEAVRLFTDRARLALPDFRLSTANATGVARICQQLDGIPLALELAAARVRSLSIDEIAAHVSGSLELLVGGSRTAAPHQRTLQTTLDWSYALLEPDEQSLFEQLSVFAGGWILEAAEVVCAGGSIRPTDVVNLLARLVEKSLVVAEHRGDRPVRYRLLETLRQYAHNQLRQRDDPAGPQRRHAEYFHRVIAGAGPELQPPHQGWWFNWCHEELDNLRAALAWAVASGNAGVGLRMAANMRRYWFHVHQTEGRSRLESLVALPSAAADVTAQADGLVALGMLARERDDLTLARSYGEQGLALARSIGDPNGVFSALVTLSWTVQFQGEWEAAERMLQECLQLAGELGDLEVGMALGGIGTLRVNQGGDDQARSILTDSVNKLRAVGAHANAAQYLCTLADIALREQQFEEAHGHAVEALSLAHGLVYAWAWETRALDLLVRLATAEHRYERAVRLAGAVSTMHPGFGRWLNRMASPEAVAFAKQELCDERAATVWAEGQAMTRDQAVVFALTI